MLHGTVAPGYEPVRRVFEENFAKRREVGAACAAFVKGEKVVDLWGGRRDRSDAPWTEDTLAIVYSTTKGMAAVAMAVAHSRGLFRLDEKVSTYWPEVAQHGKGQVTVRQLLGHEAGVAVLDEPLDPGVLADLDRLAAILAAQRPHWAPGEEQGYHAISLGFYESELLRRVDPKRRSLGRFFAEEVAGPLGVDFFIGLPEGVDRARLASVVGIAKHELVWHAHTLPFRFLLAMMRPSSLAARSLNNPRLENAADLDTPAFHRVEMPASNGIGTARAIARIYSAMAEGGAELGIDAATLRELETPGPTRRDAVLRVHTSYSCGFLKPCAMSRFGSSPRAFGTPGAGGSFGFADPDLSLGFAYVPSRLGGYLADDIREKSLRDAVSACARAAR
jgi:CubicO group peptidase (beta-lactamase class C family)